MKSSLLFLGVAVIAASVSFAQEAPVEAPITLLELNRRNVVGQLGVPLGTIVDIDAEVVSGDSLRMKQFSSAYLLKVTHVDGKKLDDPPIMRFHSLEPVEESTGLASDHFALYEMKYGKKAKMLDSSQITELEKGYVGKKVRVRVYESGGFSGIPRGLPLDMMWADTNFGFRTGLSVLGKEGKSSKGNRKKR